MPDSRKTADKGAEWVRGRGKAAEKQPEEQPKNSQNSCFLGVSAVLLAVFRLLHRDPLGTSVDGRRDCKPTSNVAVRIRVGLELPQPFVI